ncbi:DUF2334 domain-containing protein [Halobacillus locisalis]|uniref:DUF2334 domain-containing protein n=1 Tax=Halobacillus locisalis TaxID=220753 RepID=A0A838CU86_9BACI|nr:polysaccharide deacetylase family protein [Halobacillus locisalis]MBA2175453.1 DUF2334 domain-containing protein [Halobacillus locisalis]
MIRSFMCISFLLFTFLYHPYTTLASENSVAKALVVYSSNNSSIDEHQRKLDLLIGHFTSDTEFVSTNEFEPKHLEGVTHVFYQGIQKDNLDNLSKALSSFEGTIVAFGNNFEQLESTYSFVHSPHRENYNELILANKPESVIETSIQEVLSVKITSESRVLAWAKGGHQTHPMIIKNGQSYYIATGIINSQLKILLAEVFHDVFAQPHTNEKQGYIRLEDVHPLVDPVKLKQVARELKDRGIPYMVAVIPVYTKEKSGKQVHMSDYPEVLEVLKYMQKNGGSIVLHGYTHQYRSTETGEGFEFWDVENNTPIYKPANESGAIKSRKDFHNNQAYREYLDGLKDFETSYISNKITKGIHELHGFGLHPLAFEAPHYTMSQNGYQTLSNYFSMYVGQLQLSDDNWEVMEGSPYITRPSFLGGMTLLPETLGYIAPDDESAVSKIMKDAEQYLTVRDGMVSVFYHPYLGIERFTELLDQLETLPDIQWIDLKKQGTKVETSDITIEANNGTIHVDKNQLSAIISSKMSFNYFVRTTVDKVTWGMVGVGSLAVLFFSSYTVLSYRRLLKDEGDEKIG